MIDNFLSFLDEAHRLRVDHPRYPISPSFGRELASLSLECKRLGETTDLPLNTKPIRQLPMLSCWPRLQRSGHLQNLPFF